MNARAMNARGKAVLLAAAMGLTMGVQGRALAATAASAAAPEASSSAAAPASPLLGPDEQVGWVTQAEWSRRWWEWALSFDDDINPIADPSGVQCGNRQSGDVFFLAGTYGTARTVRTCRVPADKYLFFPLINYVVMPNGGAVRSCMEISGTAARVTNGAEMLVLEVDGVRYGDLQRHRQASPECFNAWARHPSGARLFPTASNGYYVMLKPLTRGRHTINFGGALPRMSQAVSYTLIVE
ncbi:hypothetical protein [Roseateles sp. L2-2]|uniref:hypothetical protein n=1 Tax=Roseateles sp. L2-2 TaxID=3422597 RepID=UPI003D363BF4